jgi:hypothetical protein
MGSQRLPLQPIAPVDRCADPVRQSRQDLIRPRRRRRESSGRPIGASGLPIASRWGSAQVAPKPARRCRRATLIRSQGSVAVGTSRRCGAPSFDRVGGSVEGGVGRRARSTSLKARGVAASTYRSGTGVPAPSTRGTSRLLSAAGQGRARSDSTAGASAGCGSWRRCCGAWLRAYRRRGRKFAGCGSWRRCCGGPRGGRPGVGFLLIRDDQGLRSDTLPGSVPPDPCARAPLHEVRRPLRVDVGQEKAGHHGRIPVDVNLGVLELVRLDMPEVRSHESQIL